MVRGGLGQLLVEQKTVQRDKRYFLRTQLLTVTERTFHDLVNVYQIKTHRLAAAPLVLLNTLHPLPSSPPPTRPTKCVEKLLLFLVPSVTSPRPRSVALERYMFSTT